MPTKSFLETIDEKNPTFLKENAGQFLVDQTNGKNYRVTSTGVVEINALPVNTKPDQFIIFNETTGLIDKAMQKSGSFKNTEGWKFAKVAPSAENNWLGKGVEASPGGVTKIGFDITPGQASQEQIAKFNEGDFNIAVADKSPLKNEAIAKANPGVTANQNFINALYQEQFNRDATQTELDKFAGRTVKDASNIILGADKSPFSIKQETPTQPTGQNAIQLPSGQIISPDDPNFEEFSKVEGATEVSSDLSELENNPFYQNLSDDLKFIAETMQELVNETDPQRKAQLEEAIELAREEVDPFNKVMVDFALQSIPDQFRLSKLTTQEKLRRNQETLKEIGNLTEDATFEEQQALGSIARTFERNIETLESNLAEGGQTFGSRRAQEERFIGEQNLDIIQSTQRGTRAQLRRLDQQRKDTQEQEKLTREAGEATLKNIARIGEETLGTERFKDLGLKDLGGQAIKPVGTTGEKGFIGTLEAQRAEQIRSLADTFANFANPKEINKLF